ncbi:MAG TPA: hypothetical protein VFA04_22245 [Bryobacteraceae bacterium]|nr:hypothetical protein [Bryobacteraceae bacterium]
MSNESSVPGVSLEAMVAMSLAWEPTSDPDAERAVFTLPRNAGRLRLVVRQHGELTIDYEDPGGAHAVRNILREHYASLRAAKKWAVLRVMALIWILERSHGNAADFHSEAPGGL